MAPLKESSNLKIFLRASHSQVVTVTGHTVFIAGRLAQRSRATPAPGRYARQLRQCCENIGRALRAAAELLGRSKTPPLHRRGDITE